MWLERVGQAGGGESRGVRAGHEELGAMWGLLFDSKRCGGQWRVWTGRAWLTFSEVHPACGGEGSSLQWSRWEVKAVGGGGWQEGRSGITVGRDEHPTLGGH